MFYSFVSHARHIYIDLEDNRNGHACARVCMCFVHKFTREIDMELLSFNSQNNILNTS